MKNRTTLGIVISFLLLGGLIIGVTSYWGWSKTHIPEEVYYEGKEVFEALDNYSEFKRAIGRDNVEIVEAEVFSSEPPIVVVFKVKAPPGEFSYGHQLPQAFGLGKGDWFGTMTAGLLGTALWVFVTIYVTPLRTLLRRWAREE